ncbi:MAG: hypothetical protein ACYDES_12990 [Acidimicrobiales bacterium]
MGSFALVDVTVHRPVSQHRAAWRDHYPDLLAIGWVVAVSVGLFIPAGQHRVVLTYWPRAFTVGLLLALVSAASLVGAGAIAWMSARRKLRP